MSKIRKPSFGKQPGIQKETKMNFYDKIKRHRLTVFYRVLLSAVVIIGMIAIVVTSYRNRIYTDYEVTATMAKENVGGTIEQRLGNAILTYSKDGAHCTDIKGNALWNQTYEMQNPLVSVCGETAAIGDYNGRTVYVVNASSKLGEIQTHMPIRSLQVAANGVVAVTLEDAKVTWIYLYDKEGNELVKAPTTMKDSGYPLSVTISPTAELAAVSYLYVDSGLLQSSVAFYNFGAVGQNYSDRYVSGYNYQDTVIPYIRFMDSATAFAVGDNLLRIYSGSQKPEEIFGTFLDKEVHSVFYNEAYIGLVYLNETGSTGYVMDIYNKKGSKVLTQEFDLDYTEIIFQNDAFIIYNETECEIYNMQGMQKYKGNFKKPVSIMMPGASSNKYILSTKDSIDMIELR